MRASFLVRRYHDVMKRRIYFIRHAIAENREVFSGDDLERPLTRKGIRKARSIFARLAERREAPNLVISSAAKRALETAELFCKAFRLSEPSIDPDLNPGATVSGFIKVLRNLPADAGCVALVGHEPDLSLAISNLIHGEASALRLKKCGIVEVEWSPEDGGVLLMSLPPDILADKPPRAPCR